MFWSFPLGLGPHLGRGGQIARKSSGRLRPTGLGPRVTDSETGRASSVAELMMHFESQHRSAGAADWLAGLERRPVDHTGGRRDGPAITRVIQTAVDRLGDLETCLAEIRQSVRELDGFGLFRVGLGGRRQLELVEHEVAVGRPAGPLVGKRLSVITSSRRPVMSVSSVSADDRHDTILVAPDDDDRAVGCLVKVERLVALMALGSRTCHRLTIDCEPSLFPSRPVFLARTVLSYTLRSASSFVVASAFLRCCSASLGA